MPPGSADMAAYGESERKMGRKRFCIRAIVDLTCVAAVALPTLLIHTLAYPFRRGFFCDDQSLIHPYKADTVPLWILVVVGMGLPIITILLVELLLPKTSRFCVLVPTEIPTVQRSTIDSSYRAIIIFLFGTTITQLLTEVGKYSVGRLRPHFLTVCKPENLPANCSHAFITDHLCTNDNFAVMKEARLSFPSGHASMAMFTATFFVVYLQARLVCNQAKLFRPVVQVFVACLALYTCFSRISDYKHHWSDVLGGSLLGIVVCALIVVSMTDFHHALLRQRGLLPTTLSRKERLPLPTYRQNNTSSSSDIPSESQETIQVTIENPK